MPSRRDFLAGGAAALAGLGLTTRPGRIGLALLAPERTGSGRVEEIAMVSDSSGAWVSFDPVGLLVPAGTTIRWIVRANVHTTTAYHPRNAHHPLRIPETATPWDSGYLVNPGSHFQVTLTVPGVYDYFCTPHEAAGMVGRIVVAHPGGPGAEPFDYWVGRPGTADWSHVPDVARRAFPGVADILARGRIPATRAPRPAP